MWKVLLGVLVAGFLLHRFAADWSARPAPDAGAVHAMPAAGGYLEARVLMRSPHLEVEMVAVSDRPTAAQCANGADAIRAILQCTDGATTCEVKSVLCRPDVDLRYRKMLDRRPAALRYAHLQFGADDALARSRAVIVGWGLTVEQSQAFCNALAEQWRQNKPGVIECI